MEKNIVLVCYFTSVDELFDELFEAIISILMTYAIADNTCVP